MNSIPLLIASAIVAMGSADTKPAARRKVGKNNRNREAQKRQRKARKKNR